MSHHNDHHHDHDHDHDHHHHGHEPDRAAPLSFADKLAKRLESWQHHNDDHLEDYRQWAREAAAQGYPPVEAELQQVVDLSRQISACLARALAAGRSGT